MVEDKTFYELFSDYFRVYLPTFKKRSEHTIRSYRTALNSLLDFVAAEKKIKLAQITFEMIDAAMISKYLVYHDELFYDLHSGVICYVVESKTWYIYTGKVWKKGSVNY